VGIVPDDDQPPSGMALQETADEADVFARYPSVLEYEHPVSRSPGQELLQVPEPVGPEGLQSILRGPYLGQRGEDRRNLPRSTAAADQNDRAIRRIHSFLLGHDNEQS